MTENFLRERQTERHEEYRPVNAVESHDVLAYDVYGGGPQLSEILRLLLIALIRIVSDRGDIVRKRIKPHVNDMSRV